MLNKKDFLKYASKLAFPIMIQNLIGTLVNVADTVMLGYVFSVYIMEWQQVLRFYVPSTGERVIKRQ